MKHAISLLRRSLWLLPSVLLLTPGELPAQESFPATHIALLRDFGSAPSEAGGVGIFQLDHAAGILHYRFTLTQSGQSVVMARLIQPPLGEFDQPDTLATETLTGEPLNSIDGSFNGLDEAAMATIERGRVSMLLYTTEFPEGYVIGQLEIVPSALGTDMDDINETTQPTGAEFADGDAFITVDEATRTARYVVRWNGLTGPATAAHFHLGAAGVAGPPIHALTLTGDSTISGVWTGMTDDDLRALKAGEVYINVHTAINPQGEIRDQMEPVEVFTAAIRPSNEVPPVSGSTLSGTGVVILQTASGVGTYLTARTVVIGADVTGAHIHRGAIGEEGTILMGLESPASSPGFWEIEEDRVTDAGDLALIRAGNTYLNYHTAANPDGEARGQLIRSPYNLTGIPVSAVPTRAESAAGSVVSARFDARDGVIHFNITRATPAGSARLHLYSTQGNRVADIPVEGRTVRHRIADLSSGQYHAQLVVAGRVVGSCVVVVVK